MDFAFMDQIIEFHEEDLDIVVQPSVSWMALNEELSRRQSGLFFPVDPGPSVSVPYLRPSPHSYLVFAVREVLASKARTLTYLLCIGEDRGDGGN